MVATQQSPWWQKTTGGAYPTATPSLAWNPYRDAQQQALQPQAQQQQSSIPTYAGMDGAAQPAGSWWQQQSAPALAGQQAQTSGSGFAKLAGTGATAGAQNAASGVSTGGAASNQSADGYTQGSGQSFQSTDYASNATSGNDAQWYDHIPEWTRGGGYPVGYDYNPQTKQWTPKGPQAAGTLVGHEVGWKTPLYLPATYNPAQDNSSFGASTGAEKGVARAIRQTADYMRANPTANAQHYFEYVIANLTRDAAKQGQSTGFDPSQFNPATQSDVAYGSAYDPNATYMAQGVMNPWTGKQAGNAQGVPTSNGNFTGGGQAPIDPTSKSPLPAGQQVPGGTTTTTGGGSGGVTNVPAGYVGGKGVGGYDWRAILNAQGDQKAGYDMLMQYMTGSMDEGTGPFAGFMKQLYGPLVTSLINAASANNGQAPTNIDDIMARLSNPSGKGADGQSIYDYLGNAGRSALQKTLTKGDVSFQDTANATALYSPLLTTGFNPIARNQYDRQQQNALVGMQAPSYWDMAAGLRGDYGAQLAGSQFYKNWWQR